MGYESNGKVPHTPTHTPPPINTTNQRQKEKMRERERGAIGKR
jgi:hypothetical protein